MRSVHAAPEPPAGWDAFVAADGGSSFCHLSAWPRVFAETLGLDTLFLWTGPPDAPTGALPLVRMPTLTGKRVLISVPYLNYGGPLGTDAGRRALGRAAVERARQEGAARVELRTRSAPGPDAGPHEHPELAADLAADLAPELAPARDKVTVCLDLPDDAGVLFEDRFRAKLRSQIRRPLKEDMETRFGPDQVDAFYAVFRENMRDLGTPVLPRRFFTMLPEVFGEGVDVGVVYHEGRPVAGGCGFHWRDEFEMTWASSLRAFNRQAPNMLLYWRFMERAIEAGRRTFNFGRSTPGEGTHRFKLQWGGEDEPLHWRQWPAEARGPDADAPFFRLATRVWRRLPLPVAGFLGPRLARRIPTF
jgi:serine/alanine adding enzyme